LVGDGKRALLALLCIALFSLNAHGADTAYERVLLPITVLDVPGVNGSIWRSEAWVHLREGGVSILPLRIADSNPLPAGSDVLGIFLYRQGQPVGQFVLVTKELIDTVDFNLRVRDMSRTSDTWGTEIPAVRESEFRAKPIALLPLPIDSGFRSTLRVYGWEESGGDVRVRVTVINTNNSTDHTVHEQTYSLSHVNTQYGVPYLQLAVDDLVGDSATETGLVRVDVEPVTEGLRLWAFVSTTDNETQHFTTITPQ